VPSAVGVLSSRQSDPGLWGRGAGKNAAAVPSAAHA
jgi:hypothetical protein